MSTKELQDGILRAVGVSIRGHLAGLQAVAPRVRQDMQATTAHGDVTGATRAGYNSRAVGAGETGDAEHARAIAAVEALNPGHIATSTVEIDGVGMILDNQTDYQKYLERERGGRDAEVGPALARWTGRLTEAAAAGSRKALG